SAARYQKIGGAIGEKIAEHLKYDGCEYVFDTVEGRCPFLDGGGLCEIYSAVGKDALCGTCGKYPRFDVDFGGRMERGISVSCPTAAELILCGDSMPALLEREEDMPMTLTEVDGQAYFSMIGARKMLLAMAEDTSVSLTDIHKRSLLFAEMWQKSLEKEGFIVADESSAPIPQTRRDNTFLRPLLSLEQLDSGWHERVRSSIGAAANYSGGEMLYRRLYHYYIYRYFAAGLFDDDILTPVKLAVYACTCVSMLAGQGRGDILDTAVSFAREVEHSGENLEILLDTLRGDEFSADRMVEML
ncbi:MAG: flagellin lysine-N-methylase, partial [Clostridia bacterium]|nr:flagellin lysine-N-methylase [Clostridia bacterium]